MPQQKNQKTAIAKLQTWFRLNKRKIFIWAAVVALLLGAVCYFNYAYRSYAEEVARPLEQALEKAGAKKKCVVGDAGRGWDNTQPWYNSYFELPASRAEAFELVARVASDNGYKLSHATLANRGTVPVGDDFVENWFYNTVQKTSPYQDLEAGDIELFFTVDNDKDVELSGLSCGTTSAVILKANKDASAIGIRVSLPSFKRR